MAGQGTQSCQSLMTNAALRAGHGPQESRVVVVVDPQAKPRTQIFDFCAVKKTLSARYLVRNLRASQSFFKGLGHVIGTVQNSKLFVVAVLHAARSGGGASAQRLNASHHAVGFVFFVVGIHHANWFAFAQFRKKFFRIELRIGLNHVVGRSQNGAGRAVVLL